MDDKEAASENGRDEVTASGMGFAATFKGQDIIKTLLMAAALFMFGYLIYQQHEAQNTRFDAIAQQLEKLGELQYLIAWVNSQPADKRPALNLPPQMWKYLDQGPLINPDPNPKTPQSGGLTRKTPS